MTASKDIGKGQEHRIRKVFDLRRQYTSLRDFVAILVIREDTQFDVSSDIFLTNAMQHALSYWTSIEVNRGNNHFYLAPKYAEFIVGDDRIYVYFGLIGDTKLPVDFDVPIAISTTQLAKGSNVPVPTYRVENAVLDSAEVIGRDVQETTRAVTSTVISGVNVSASVIPWSWIVVAGIALFIYAYIIGIANKSAVKTLEVSPI